MTLSFHLNVHRFFCDNRQCQRKTFTEKLPMFVAPYARRTLRLAARQRQTALALGGEAGARLLEKLTMPTSGDTLLRLIRGGIADLPNYSKVRVVGIDDWAWRKGQRYGTILVDLETHRPIDLLPDRSAESVAAWLKGHPEVEIICRDRAEVYKDGATQGAPNAIQVADRWHLLANLRDVLERVLDHHRNCLYAAAAKPEVPVPPEPKRPSSKKVANQPTKVEQNRQATRQRRLERYQAVVDLHRRGFKKRAIARQVGLDRRTVSRYIQAGHFPEMAQRRKSPSVLDPFRSYLDQRWQTGCQNGAQLYREIKAKLTQFQMVGSMSRKGNCYDNAPMESFFGTFKTELTFHCDYATRNEARLDIFEDIEVFYNRQRRHSALGYKSPAKYETLSLVA